MSISDQRLQEILNLVQSIPFPEGAPPPPEDEYDAVDIENIPLEIVDNMKAKKVRTEVKPSRYITWITDLNLDFIVVIVK